MSSFLNWVIPFLLGSAVVLQGGLNRKFFTEVGVTPVVLTNAITLSALALLAYFLTPGATFQRLTTQPWAWFPGIFGFLIVAGVPWGIQRLGANRFFILFIVAQLLISLWWDWQFEDLAISPQRIIGILLGLAGAALVVLY